jgi:hypothetical protein
MGLPLFLVGGDGRATTVTRSHMAQWFIQNSRKLGAGLWPVGHIIEALNCQRHPNAADTSLPAPRSLLFAYDYVNGARDSRLTDR